MIVRKANKSKAARRVGTATLLALHVKQVSKEVVAEWPAWKQVVFNPRTPRNGFKG